MKEAITEINNINAIRPLYNNRFNSSDTVVEYLFETRFIHFNRGRYRKYMKLSFSEQARYMIGRHYV